MRDHRDQFEATSDLRDRVHKVGAQFLLTETSTSDEANERRGALALEAYEVVADRLAQDPAVVGLTEEERATISELHQELGKRLNR
ncbi:MAG TPA: hypothetical protein VFY90_10640 [Tepidiformaceae bacterium]|nr:hypothetical protein [Tepidiformaceae bacterium]